MSEFKDMLKYFRMKADLSQSELAEKIGVSTSTISMYEVGKREPDFETEEKLADFFNTDLDTLRGRDTERESTLKPGLNIVDKEGNVKTFDFTSLVYSIMETVADLPADRQEIILDVVEGQKRRKQSNHIATYNNKVSSHLDANAAHIRTDVLITSEDLMNDNDIMNDDNF